MFVRWMRGMICAILLIAIMGSTVGAEAAGDIRIILKLRTGALIGPLLTLLGADLLDSIPSVNLYLLRVPHVPALSFTLSLLGVVYIETDTTMDNPTFRNMGLLTSVAPPDFSSWPTSTARPIPVILRCRAMSLEVSTSYRPRDQRMLSSISPHRISSIRPHRAFSISRAPLIRQPPPL